MLYRIRTDINQSGSCMLKDGQNLLSLCVVPFYEEKLDAIENMGETSHKAPVLLDCFFENFAMESWDLTTQKVNRKFLLTFFIIFKKKSNKLLNKTLIPKCRCFLHFLSLLFGPIFFTFLHIIFLVLLITY